MKAKTNKILMWMFVALITLQFLAASLGKFTGGWTNMFIEWGYSISFMYVVGTIEIAGVAGLYFAKIRKWAVMILVLTMLGAMITHVMNNEYVRLIHNGVIILLLYIIFYLNKKRTQIKIIS